VISVCHVRGVGCKISHNKKGALFGPCRGWEVEHRKGAKYTSGGGRPDPGSTRGEARMEKEKLKKGMKEESRSRYRSALRQKKWKIRPAELKKARCPRFGPAGTTVFRDRNLGGGGKKGGPARRMPLQTSGNEGGEGVGGQKRKKEKKKKKSA